MAEEQVHLFFFFCHAFSLSITWGRGTRKDQTTCSYHATTSRDWQLQLFTTSIGLWTILSTIPLEVSLQHLTTTLEKEGESCLLEDFPKEAALENCGIDPRWRKWLKGPLKVVEGDFIVPQLQIAQNGEDITQYLSRFLFFP